VCACACGCNMHSFSDETECKQPYKDQAATVKQSQTSAACRVAPLQPFSAVYTGLRRNSLEHTELGVERGCRHPPTSQLLVTRKPEDGNVSMDEDGQLDFILCNAEETVQKRMEGRVLTSSHKHNSLPAKVPSMKFSLLG